MPKIQQPTTLTEKLRDVKMPKQPKRPLWDGPESDSEQGGVTQSLLSRFLTCRERFRMKVIEGFRTVDSFSHLLEYGNLWHVCEEALARDVEVGIPSTRANLWENTLDHYAGELLQKYPLQRQQVEHWYEVCRLQFPLYVEYWSKHPDVLRRTPLMQEQVFKVPYKLPSGRTVWLRGKYDSVDLIQGGIWLAENKTKGDIDEQQMRRQLTGDLQTMLYLTVLSWENDHDEVGNGLPSPQYRFGGPIKGIRYNVIRRPLSGGKGMIRLHEGKPSEPCGNCNGTGRTPKLGKVCSRCKGGGRTEPVAAETKEHFYGRVAQYIKDEPEIYFMRWTVSVLPSDIVRFRKRVLDPVLEQLCIWYDWVACCARDNHNPFDQEGEGIHWQHPFGADNNIDLYGHSDLDSYIETGNEAGLQRMDNLFPELTAE